MNKKKYNPTAQVVSAIISFVLAIILKCMDSLEFRYQIYKAFKTNPEPIINMVFWILIIFGVIDIIVAAIVMAASNNNNATNQSDSDIGKKICKKCSTINPSSNLYCSLCGSPLSNIQTNTSVNSNTGMKNCQNCGASNPISTLYCSVCGQRLEAVKKQSVAPNEWQCPKCGKVHQSYVGTCGCGQQKP